MIPWIQVYSNLPMHPKTDRLVDELGLSSSAVSPNIVAVGILVSLWTWAIQNAYDGDLSRCSPRLIADACRWKKKPEALIMGLRAAGWLDEDMKLHDWEEYAVLLMDTQDNQKEKTRERVRKYREKKKAEIVSLECQYCGAPATGYDHIIPLSRGGTDDEENLVPCCPFCNSAKQDRPLDIFLNRHRERVRDDLVTKNQKLKKYVFLDKSCNRYVTVTGND